MRIHKASESNNSIRATSDTMLCSLASNIRAVLVSRQFNNEQNHSLYIKV